MYGLIGMFMLGNICGIAAMCIITANRERDKEINCLKCIDELRSKIGNKENSPESFDEY